VQGQKAIRRLLVMTSIVLVSFEAHADERDVGFGIENRRLILSRVEYQPHQVTESDHPGRMWVADNPSQQFAVHFGAQDVVLSPRGQGTPPWRLGLRLKSWGTRRKLEPVGPAEAFSVGSFVEYQRGPITEWYANTDVGLQQGFTIAAPPDERGSELTLEIAVTGDFVGRLSESGSVVAFHHEESGTLIRCEGAVAIDAAGSDLDARMEFDPVRMSLSLAVAIGGVSWPIYVDPVFSRVAKFLPAPDPSVEEAQFGRAIAVDGNLMIVGTDDIIYGENPAVAYVFLREDGSSGPWIHVADLVSGEGVLREEFGWSVSISGWTAIVGAYRNNVEGEDYGVVYVFECDPDDVRDWRLVETLRPSQFGWSPFFGYSLSISGDTAAIGAPGEGYSGSVYLFRRDLDGPDAWGLIGKLAASDGGRGDSFGISVDIDGDVVIVGSYLGDGIDTETGTAYLFERDPTGTDDWRETARLTADDGARSDRFGYSVGISRDTAIVGAHRDDLEGSAYLFERDSDAPSDWKQSAKLSPDVSAYGSYFGYSVGISSDTAIVGAYGDDANALDSGSAVVYRRDPSDRNTWLRVAKLVASDGGVNDEFGHDVAIDDDIAVVGARLSNGNTVDEGSVYVFGPLGIDGAWVEWAKLTCPPVWAARADALGTSLAISGDYLAVGAPGDDDAGLDAGTAYIFERNLDGGEWVRVARITSADAAAGDEFGISIAVSGDRIIVGSHGDDDNGTNSGSAYIFQRNQGQSNSWNQVAKITPSDGAEYDRFGSSVDLTDDTAVVGAQWDDDGGPASGSAYVFRPNPVGLVGWGEVAKIVPTDGEDVAHFGVSVAVGEESLIVGAYKDDAVTSNSGAAYVFRRDLASPAGWIQVAKLVPTDSRYSSYFGWAVDLDGDIAVVGAVKGGKAYVFRRHQGGLDEWGLMAEIIPADGETWDSFGFAVAVRDGRAIVGALGDYGNGQRSGSAYAFQKDRGGPNAWGLVEKIAAGDLDEFDLFGFSVAIDGLTAAVGAPGDGLLGHESGSVYIFDVDESIDPFEP